MTFVPASPEDAGSVTIVGAVDVADRVGRLLGHVTVDNASLAVTGPLTDAQLAARLPLGVTGPLTDAQFAARLPLHTIVDSGSVNVGNFPADQGVHFTAPQHVIVDSGSVAISGSVTVGNFPATYAVTQSTSPWVVDGSAVTQPVSGPLTDAQLRASRVPVDGSGVTQPVSVASLPLPAGASTEATLAAVQRADDDTALTAILLREKMATE
jgi:hypothetical protein